MSALTGVERVSQEIVDQAANMLLDAAPAGSEVILFGSYATGRASEYSDADFLIVEPVLTDAWHESVRLRRHVAKVPLAMDVIVVSRERFERERGQVNSIVASAARDGRVYHRGG